jgi:hypothetical protein
MDQTSLFEQISRPDFDQQHFSELAIAQPDFRTAVVRQMVENPAIMVYYHCFYILERVSQAQPDLLYPFWDEFAGLLAHPNSYHRDFGLVLLANLSGVDRDHHLDAVLDQYLLVLADPKFMTANCCLVHLKTILQNRSDLAVKILPTLLELPATSPYPEKQTALMMFDVLDILEIIYPPSATPAEVQQFIKAQTNSLSPKTRKKAKLLLSKLFK